jgi:uncharacterized protein (DUF486 family)
MQEFFADNIHHLLTIAWYGHLKCKDSPPWQSFSSAEGLPRRVLFSSAGESNPHNQSNAAQLKTILKVITLVAFCG